MVPPVQLKVPGPAKPAEPARTPAASSKVAPLITVLVPPREVTPAPLTRVTPAPPKFRPPSKEGAPEGNSIRAPALAVKVAFLLVPPPAKASTPVWAITVPVLLNETPPFDAINSVLLVSPFLINVPLLLKAGGGLPPVLLKAWAEFCAVNV